MCIRLTAGRHFVLMLEVQIWQFLISKMGQGGFFTKKPIYNYKICMHAGTPIPIPIDTRLSIIPPILLAHYLDLRDVSHGLQRH